MKALIYHKSTSDFYSEKNINNARLSKNDKLPLIRFDCFKHYPVEAVFTTKIGGVSGGYLSSLNLDDDQKDIPGNVYKNYGLLAENLGIKQTSFVRGNQVHKSRVMYIDESFIPFTSENIKYPDTDGFFTDKEGPALCIGGADCTPVYLYDPVVHAIALVHSGWRGTAAGIGKNAVLSLTRLGSNPENITALIGPSISMENYEVTSDVIDEFKSAFNNTEMKDIAFPTYGNHFQLDLWAACFHVLKNSGLNPENIYFSNICTYENHRLLYSHRYTQGLRGNMNGIMFLKNI